MAKINPIKLKQDADKLEKAGRLEQAIALYRQITDDNPRDWNTINKVGDLYGKLNRAREASVEYAKVADFYAKDGFLLKAIAIWKKINKLDASALEPYLNLADLYAKQGLMMEAKGQYQVVVDEYVKRGKVRDAGEVLRKMAEIDPGDLKIRSKLADLYTREGSSAKAVEEHIAIADELSKKGHLAEALQVLEKGLKIDPRNTPLRLALGRVHIVQKNYERAAHFLEEAVQHSPNEKSILARLGEAYLGDKKIEEAEAIFKRLLELDSKDEEAHLQMGRVYLLQSEYDKAYDEFQPIVERLVDRKEGEKAAAVLQQVTQKNPSHVKSLVKLVDIYRFLKMDTAVLSTYSQLTEAYMNQGQLDQAAAVLEILVSQEPQNQQHRTKLEFVRGKLKGAPRAAATAPTPRPATPPQPDFLEEEFDFGPTETTPSATTPAPSERSSAASRSSAAPGVAPSRQRIEIAGPLSDDDKEFIEEHLAEGKVFRKYGLVDKASDQFESIIARFPDHVEARQELRDVYKEKGLLPKAVEQSLALAEIFRFKGDSTTAAIHEAEARRGSPSAVAAPRPAAVERPSPPAPRAAEEPPSVAITIEAEEEIVIGEADEDIAIEMSSEVKTTEGELDFADIESGGELPSRFLEDEPLAEAESDLSLEVTPSPQISPPPRPAPATATPLAAPPAPTSASAARGLPADIQRTLEEADTYVSLGFVEDAKDALAELSRRHPGHPAIAARMADLGLELDTAVEHAEPSIEGASAEDAVAEPLEELSFSDEPSLAEPSDFESGPLLGEELSLESEKSILDESPSRVEPEPDSDLVSEPEDASVFASEPTISNEGALDLSVELEELFSAQAAVEEAPETPSASVLGEEGLADIFKEFKKGVDKQLGKEDYDTRYNLGIAYKEMGLVDEAIAEFQLAAKDESRLLECSSMLGICFLEKGMPKLAIKWFEKGLHAPQRTEEEYQGLRYDLAMAHEAAGEPAKALLLFTELYGQDANFRDVAAKVRELKAGQH